MCRSDVEDVLPAKIELSPSRTNTETSHHRKNTKIDLALTVKKVQGHYPGKGLTG